MLFGAPELAWSEGVARGLFGAAAGPPAAAAAATLLPASKRLRLAGGAVATPPDGLAGSPGTWRWGPVDRTPLVTLPELMGGRYASQVGTTHSLYPLKSI